MHAKFVENPATRKNESSPVVTNLHSKLHGGYRITTQAVTCIGPVV